MLLAKNADYVAGNRKSQVNCRQVGKGHGPEKWAQVLQGDLESKKLIVGELFLNELAINPRLLP